MYTSISWETEGAFEVAFKLRQPSLHRGDAIGLGMRSSESMQFTFAVSQFVRLHPPKCVFVGRLRHGEATKAVPIQRPRPTKTSFVGRMRRGEDRPNSRCVLRRLHSKADCVTAARRTLAQFESDIKCALRFARK